MSLIHAMREDGSALGPLAKIANQIGVSRGTVFNYLKANGLYKSKRKEMKDHTPESLLQGPGSWLYAHLIS